MLGLIISILNINLLQELWAALENHKGVSSSLQSNIGAWLLSCTKLRFEGNTIVAAHFDNDSFCKLYERETVKQSYHNSSSGSPMRGSSPRGYQPYSPVADTVESRAVKKSTSLSARYNELADKSDISHLYNNMLAAGAAAYGDDWGSTSSLDSDGLRDLDHDYGYSSTDDIGRVVRKKGVGNNDKRKHYTDSKGLDHHYSSDEGSQYRRRTRTHEPSGSTKTYTRKVATSRDNSVKRGVGVNRKLVTEENRSHSSPGRIRKPTAPDKQRNNHHRSPAGPDMRSSQMSSVMSSTAELSSLKCEMDDAIGQFRHDLNMMRVELRATTAIARSRSNSPDSRQINNVGTMVHSNDNLQSGVDESGTGVVMASKSRLTSSRLESKKFPNKAAEAAYYRSRYDAAVSEIAQLERLLSTKSLVSTSTSTVAKKKQNPAKGLVKEMELAMKNANMQLELERSKKELEIQQRVQEARDQVMAEMENQLKFREETARQKAMAEMETMMRIKMAVSGPGMGGGRGRGLSGRGPGLGGRGGESPTLSRANSATQRGLRPRGLSDPEYGNGQQVKCNWIIVCVCV